MQGSFKGHFLCLGYKSAQKRILKDLKEEESLKLKTFKILQYNITYILHINCINRIFCSIYDFTFLMTDTKI